MVRFFDILFSGLALLLLSPLLLPIVITLKLTGEGEVLFLDFRKVGSYFPNDVTLRKAFLLREAL